jgi:biopolymer transport protein ExbD
VGIYILVAGALLLRLCAGLAMSQRLLRHSRATGRRTEGIEIRESDAVAAPVALGIAHSVIVLPRDWREWEPAKLEAVVAHERSHIRRGDPVVQLLSAIHRALLWHSPLSWFLHRQVVRVAEEASDDAAVSAMRDRASYAEVLLEFMQRGVRGANWQGVAMARYSRPEERIHRILEGTALSRGVTRWSLAAILVLGLPLVYITAATQSQVAAIATAAQPSGAIQFPGVVHVKTTDQDLPLVGVSRNGQSYLNGRPVDFSALSGAIRGRFSAAKAVYVQADRGTPWDSIAKVAATLTESGFEVKMVAETAPAVESARAAAASTAEPAVSAAPSAQASATASPAQAATTQAATPQRSGKIRQYMIFSNDSISGSWNASDRPDENELREKFGRNFAWFWKGGNEYVVTDAGVLAELKEAMAPQKEVNRMQGEVNAQQAVVNQHQAEVNRAQDGVNTIQAAVNRRQHLINELEAAKGDDELIRKLEAMLAELRAKKGEGADQEAANRAQAKVNEMQGRVNEEQGRVNEQQHKVNDEQHRVSAKYEGRIEEILDSAVKRHLAEQPR